MNVQLLCVGKLKEPYLKQGCQEYIKRMKAYSKLQVIEIAEEKAQEPLSVPDVNRILIEEGKRIQKQLKPNTYLIALAIKGKMLSSPQLAQKVDHLLTTGRSHLTFVIGGSYGLAPEILARADDQLSFSPMTFPHQLMRLILLEQLYRACKINRNEVYHK